MLAGFLMKGKEIVPAYLRILKSSGISGTDYLKEEGGAAAMFNMGVNGLWLTPPVNGGNGYGNFGIHTISARLTG